MKIQGNLYDSYRLEGLKGKNDPDAIKKVAKEMESLFAYELIKVMRQTTSLSKGPMGQDIYMSMFDIEIARLIAERGLGIQDMIIKNLQKHAPQVNKELNSDNPEKEQPQEIKANRLPVSGEISSHFGMRRHPVYGDWRFHNGIDIVSKEGSPVFAAMQGKVVFSGEMPGYGNTVIIDHLNGYYTVYAHNKINHVREGQQVDQSTIIAEVGSTGTSTGPHLHFEVRYGETRIDPITFLAMNK